MTLPTQEAPERAPAAARAPRPRSAPTRVAVVGAGFIADFHLEILRGTPEVEVVAVCDPARERAESAARRFGVPRAVASARELAELGCDVAHVLVPPPLHVPVARELLELGVGCFVEKPLALSAADARALAELARERGLVLGVNHNAVHHPAFARLLGRLRRGEIGRVEHVQVTLSVPLRQLDAGDVSHWMFRAPRNIVFEQAPHPFAQLAELVGGVRSARTELLASRELQPGQVFHERWLVAARAERGTAEVYLAFGAPFTRSSIEVLGTDGRLEADLTHDLVSGERKSPWLDFWNSFLAGWRAGGELRRGALRGLFLYLRQTLGLGRREDAFYAGMRGSIRAFHAALRAGEPPPADGAAGVRVLEWCEAAAEGVPGEASPPELPPAGPPRAGEIVVLGGTGFIGRRVVERLRAAGSPVTCVVRRAHGLPPALVDAARAGDVRLVRGSLEDAGALQASLAGTACVVHLATGGGATWEAVERAMVQGTRRLAEACLEAGVGRLVFASSTAALYLGPDAGPAVEDDVPADPEPEKRALYARGKVLAERELLRLHRERGLPVTIVRPGVVLGEGTPMQHSGLGLWVRDNHCVGWGRGDTPVPLVWVDDVADAIAALARHAGADLDGRALNLCAAPPLTAAEVVRELARATGRRLSFHPRPLALSQAMEIGKWLVKKAGRRRGVEPPSWRDLKSRSMAPRLPCRTARTVLGWRPVEDRERFLDVAVRSYGRRPE